MRINDLQEDATGFVGSANIAGNPNPSRTPMRRHDVRGGENAWHAEKREQRDQRNDPEFQRRAELEGQQANSLQAAKAKLAKQRSFFGRLKSFLANKQRGGNFRISESFDMQDVMSRLSGLEADGRAGDATVSFGIEDDDGNLMKVTVRSDQSEEFEEALANELADAARRKEVTGEETSISMAELLLKLNDQFDIVDASFPTIPTDGVYNADKIQYGVADTGQEELGNSLDAFPDDGMGSDPMAAGGDPMGAEGDPMAGDGMGDDPMAGGGDPMGAEGDPMAGDGMGDDPMADDGSVEDFPADELTPEDPEQSVIVSILNMLKAEAETRKAEADARAEEARAKQAEFTAMASKNAVAQEEEVARMEAEIEARKAKEKDAKRISDLARYRVTTASGLGEGAKFSFGQFLDVKLEVDNLLEFEEFDTVQSLNRQRGTLRLKYAIQPEDNPNTVRYKREALMTASRELDAKIRHAAAAKRYRDAEAAENAKKPQPTQQPGQQPGQQGQQQGQVNGQQGAPNAL